MTDSISSLITAVEQADSPILLVGAVRALATARSIEAIPILIRALGFNNPGAAVAAVEGLVQLGSVAVQPILEQLDDYDYGARAYAVRALAAIGDPRALDLLIAAAETDFAPSVRRAAVKGIGCLQWQSVSAEQVPGWQKQVWQTLLRVSQDTDWAIRYAAVVGMQGLASSLDTSELNTSSLELVQAIAQRLTEMAQTDPEAVLQARVQLAADRLQVLSARLAVSP